MKTLLFSCAVVVSLIGSGVASARPLSQKNAGHDGKITQQKDRDQQKASTQKNNGHNSGKLAKLGE